MGLHAATTLHILPVADRAGSGVSKGKPMTPADSGELSLTERAKLGVAYFFGEALFWVGLFLTVWAGSYSIYLGGGVCLCWGLIFVLIMRRELSRDIKALDDPNDNPRADRLIGKGLPRTAAPGPDTRMRRARGTLKHMALRFAVEFLTSVAIIIAVTLGTSLAAETVVFALSDRDVSGAFGSGLAGAAGGVFGLVFAVVIVIRRIADIED